MKSDLYDLCIRSNLVLERAEMEVIMLYMAEHGVHKDECSISLTEVEIEE